MTDPERLAAALGDGAPEVARIVPRLRTIFPDLKPPADLPPEQARHYLFTCLTEYLERATSGQPTVLLLDDIHWADDFTALLLEHIAGSITKWPMLIIGTYRDTDLNAQKPFARPLDCLSRLGHVERVPIRRFCADGVGDLLKALSGKEPPQALTDLVASETEGVPFFVQEVYRYLSEQGRLFDESGAWLAGVEIGEVEVPEGVRLVIGRRLERVTEETRRVLTEAAVIGRAFSFDLLAELSKSNEDSLLDAVEEAEEA